MRYSILTFTLLILTLLSLSLRADEGTITISFHGLTGEPLQNVETRLSKLPHHDIKVYIKSAHHEIQKALEPLGYFKSTVTESAREDKTGWHVDFYISKGPALHIATCQIQVQGPGKDNLLLYKAVKRFPLHQNDIFHAGLYQHAVEELYQTAYNQGYLKARYTVKEIKINLDTYTATIHLTLDTGERYYFGTITFSNTALSPTFLQRFKTFHEDEPFSSDKLIHFQNDLSNSRYFQHVTVTPDLAAAQGNKVPVHVDVAVPKSQQYKMGIGYGTFTGPRLTMGVDWRRVTDGGQHFNLEMKLSKVIAGLAAKYYIPGSNPLTDQYTLGADFQRFTPKNGNSYSQKLSTSYLKTWQDWQTSTGLNYLNERYYVDYPPYHSSHLLYPALDLSRIQADDMAFPREGYMIHVNLQGAIKDILSTTTFAQTDLKGKYITSPTQDSRVLIRGELGYTSVNDLQKLPLSMQFFAGGINTVRGIPYDNLGPGRYLKVASAEYQHKIIGDFYGAIFYDVGTASDDFNQSLSRGDGLGAIYKSLIGTFKLYVARAESQPGKPYTVEFSIGSDF